MLAVMLWSSAVFLNGILGLGTGSGIWLTVFLVGFYTVMGGLTAVVLTDVIQMVIMFVGNAGLLFLTLWKIGGVGAVVEQVKARGPEFQEHFELLLPNATESPYPWTGILFGLGIVLSTAYFSSNQAVIQRVLGAHSEWHAKASLLFAAFLKLLVPVLIILPRSRSPGTVSKPGRSRQRRSDSGRRRAPSRRARPRLRRLFRGAHVQRRFLPQPQRFIKWPVRPSCSRRFLLRRPDCLQVSM